MEVMVRYYTEAVQDLISTVIKGYMGGMFYRDREGWGLRVVLQILLKERRLGIHVLTKRGTHQMAILVTGIWNNYHIRGSLVRGFRV